MRVELFRTAAFQGAMLVTLTVLIATVAALTLQYSRTFSVLEAESRHLVQVEVERVKDRYAVGGIAEVARFIALTQRMPGPRDSVFLLATNDNRVVAGDIDRWPTEARARGWNVFKVPVRSDTVVRERRVEALVLPLGAKNLLLVGHLTDGRDQLRARYLEALAVSVSVAGFLGLLLGYYISRRAFRFVDRMAQTGNRFLAGHYSERLPVTGRGDESDRLSEVINACFAEVEHTIASLRAATDGLAHDLKTPLTRMKARAELAIMRNTFAAPDFLVATASDIDALLKLINDLLALARVDAVTPEMFQPLDLADVAREAIELYEPVLEAAGREFVARLESAPVSGMPSLLFHAACNLIDNALKHAPESGSIQITTASTAGSAELRISDAGPGIAEQHRQRATDRLVRLDGSRSTEGSGLGLSIVAAAVRAHKGELVLEDNLPGLKAVIRLPLYHTIPSPS